MHRSRVQDEVRAGPGESGEELRRQEIALEPVAPRTGKHDVPGNVCATARQRMNVVERREVELERRRAIDAASAAVAHSGALDRSLLVPGGNGLGPAVRAWQAWEGDTVKMPTS